MEEFAQPLREEDVDPDPVVQFAAWFAAASEAGIREPEAAAVATASADGAPSVRMVLVKRMEADGFVFFTNYEGRKGRDLTENPRAALLFYWDALGRQVRLEGPVARTTSDETAEYVRSRPRASRLSALASPQSAVVADRAELEDRVAELTARYRDHDPPIADDWGGFRVIPESVEFWQHRRDRLHDRLLYLRAADGGWSARRLAP